MHCIAVTGSSGFFASKLLPLLVEAPGVERVVGLDIREPRFEHPRFSSRRTDITLPVVEVLREEAVESLIHLAFAVGPIHDQPRMAAVNLQGTRSVLKACGEVGLNRVMVVSSTKAYGAHPDNPVPLTEEARLRANQDYQYAWEKAQMDRMAQEFARAHPQAVVIIPRPCMVIGPGMRNFISRYASLPFVLAVAGHDPPMQFLHQEDLVVTLLELFLRGESGPYNVTPDDWMPLSEIAELVGKSLVRLPQLVARGLVGLSWRLHLGPLGVAPPSFLHFIRYPWVATSRKLQKELGVRFRYGTQEAVLRVRDRSRPG